MPPPTLLAPDVPLVTSERDHLSLHAQFAQGVVRLVLLPQLAMDVQTDFTRTPLELATVAMLVMPKHALSKMPLHAKLETVCNLTEYASEVELIGTAKLHPQYRPAQHVTLDTM